MGAGIGHNGGPQMRSVAWQAHCWRAARQQLLPVLPIEVVRLRVRRAQALGLDYRTYAGIRATTGRDLVAFLFSSNALGVFRDGAPLPADCRDKLAGLAAERHLGTAPGLDDAALARQIGADSVLHLPRFGQSWAAMRDQMKLWLHDRRLPGDAVLMIGETDHEREAMTAGGLAGFVSGNRYFGRTTHAI
ncbi:hypothetical protein [Paracoccus sp. (in: a-proteobacteria)]|uniref:hypothetical protein n=1 Tax=Paracoccus sp. TaxID=267 RepID=UPI003A8AE24E